jgi:hypothetical protein
MAGLSQLVRLCLRCWATRPPAQRSQSALPSLHQILQAEDDGDKVAVQTMSVTSSSHIFCTSEPSAVSYPSSLFDLHCALSDEAYQSACQQHLLVPAVAGGTPQSVALVLHLPKRSSDLFVQSILFLALHRLQSNARLSTLEDAFDRIPTLLIVCGNAILHRIASQCLNDFCTLPAIRPFAPNQHRPHLADIATARAIFRAVSPALPQAVSETISPPHVLSVSRESLLSWIARGAVWNDKRWLEHIIRTRDQ